MPEARAAKESIIMGEFNTHRDAEKWIVVVAKKQAMLALCLATEGCLEEVKVGLCCWSLQGFWKTAFWVLSSYCTPARTM